MVLSLRLHEAKLPALGIPEQSKSGAENSFLPNAPGWNTSLSPHPGLLTHLHHYRPPDSREQHGDAGP